MKLLKVLFAAFFIMFFSGISFADSTVVFTSVDIYKPIDIGNSIQILDDQKKERQINDVIHSVGFKASTRNVPSIQLGPYSSWVKFQITNLSDQPELLFNLAYPTIDEVDLYTLTDSNSFTVQKSGHTFLVDDRKYKHQDYIFDLVIPKGETQTYFLRVKGGEQILLPLQIGSSNSIWETISTKDTMYGLYFGIILVMFFYNLFIYASIRDVSYLYYVVYIALIGLTQVNLAGYPFKYLWANSSWMITHSTFILPGMVGFSIIAFFRNFLQTKKQTPSLDKGLFLFIAFYFVSIVLALGDVYEISYIIIQLNGLIATFYVLFVAIKISLKGSRPAKFFLIAWTLFLIGVFAFAMKDFDILPYDNYTIYTMPAGSALEVILLSFALADRINVLKREKEESQAQVLVTLQENSRIINEQNVLLESKVKERTSELESTNKNLKETQSQLVNAEKMASLGQLTAGIAHEINNPINFVLSNIKPLRSDVEDVFSLLAKYNDIKDAENISEKLKEINDFKVKNDTDYLLTEINQLLKGIDEGAIRTVEIVKGLKTFSHIDETDLKSTNIIEGLDSTLIILNSSIKNSKIKVIKEYDNAILKIDCLGGQINQVFMNIINNAVQAMAETKDPQKENILTIRTTTISNNAIIGIKDNGTGIPNEIKSKIFDPFFSTKAVGSGTGLGLSITYSIIKDHKGMITVESEVGKGTEFIISLPISRI